MKILTAIVEYFKFCSILLENRVNADIMLTRVLEPLELQKKLDLSGVTRPIGQGWTKATGLGGLRGPKPGPKKIFVAHRVAHRVQLHQ